MGSRVLLDLDSHLANVQTQNELVYTEYQQTFENILSFSKPIKDTLYAISNNQTGLATNLNCTYVTPP
jgi:hypothetical protein